MEIPRECGENLGRFGQDLRVQMGLGNSWGECGNSKGIWGRNFGILGEILGGGFGDGNFDVIGGTLRGIWEGLGNSEGIFG